MKTNRSAFVTLISVFFFWGFVAASNDILIPVFKEKLNLEQWQSQLISVAFYVAYTVGSLIYVFFSWRYKGDILNKLGYRNGIALGLCVSAIGAFLFYPAAEMVSFGIMITGLFIVGLGFSLQQTAANPLAITLGPPEKGSQRLSLAGGINNVGTTIGPLVISFFIFGSVGDHKPLEDLDDLKVPYMVLALAFLVVAVIFKFSSLPNQLFDEANTPGTAVEKKVSPVVRFPQLSLGMIAIFLYVGVEVATASNLPEYMRLYSGVPTSQAAPFISLFWASLMIGRWTSSASVFSSGGGIKEILRIVMPYLAFGIFLLVNAIAGVPLEPFYPYGWVILILVLAERLSKGDPARQLVIFSACGIMSLLVGMFSEGIVSLYAFIGVGLFCSTLWPCIFTVAIAGLGKYTNQGSSYLVMMIMGGGLVSWLQGWLAAPELLGIRYSYVVGVACFLYLGFYGWRVASVLRKQGVDASQTTSVSH